MSTRRNDKILVGEKWHTRDVARYHPDNIQFLMVLATDSEHTLVNAFTKGLCVTNTKDFRRVYEKDYTMGRSCKTYKKSVEKILQGYRDTKCKHSISILTDKFKINKQCKDCFPSEHPCCN